jgi:hypothetical protein
MRLKIVDLGQGVEAVLREQHLVATLAQEDFRAAADRVAVVDDQHPGRRRGVFRQLLVAHHAPPNDDCCCTPFGPRVSGCTDGPLQI